MELSDYMQSQLTDAQGAGEYRGFPLSWTVEPATKAGSQSVAVVINFGISEEYVGEEAGWSQPWPPGFYATGRTYVVKADGTINQNAVDALAKAGLWNGDWDAFAGSPPQVFCLLSIESNEWQGKTSYRVAWINPNADKPRERGGLAPADPTVLARLRQQFGGQTRAIAGGNPGGAAPAPPTAVPAIAPPPPEIPHAEQPLPWAQPAAAPSAGVVAPPTVVPPTPMPSVEPTPAPVVAAPVAAPVVAPTPVAPAGEAAPFAGPPAAGTADDPVDPGKPPF